MILKIVRFKNIKDATLGRFILEDDSSRVVFSGYTLEPSGPDEINRGLDRRVPQGRYKTRWHNSPKFKRRLVLLYNELVSQDRYILIHAGNYGKDTEGCVVVGLRYDENGVYNSRETLNKLISLIKERELEVEIVNANGI